MEKSGINLKQIENSNSILLEKISKNIDCDKNWRCNYISVRSRKPGARAAVVLRATNNKLDLAVKHFIPKQGEVTQAAIREFQLLEQIYSSLSASFKHIIPKPIYATTDAYAAEWVNLPSMKLRLAWARFNSVTRLSCLRAAARALKVIHQAGKQPAIPLELSTYITAARCSAAPDPSWDRNLDHFINILKRFEGVEVPYCRAHGDYSPENILFSPKRTVVIDFAYDATSPIYRDICHFIMYFSVYCNNFVQNAVDTTIDDANHFYEIYSKEDKSLDLDILLINLWATMIIRWGRHEFKYRDPERALHLRLLDRHFAGQLKLNCLRLQEILASS